MDKIQKETFQIISNVFEIKEDKVSGKMSWEDNDVDSFALVELIVAVQDHFNIHFESSELDGFSTVQDLVNAINKKL